MVLVLLARATPRLVGRLGEACRPARVCAAFCYNVVFQRRHKSIPVDNQSVVLPGPERIRASRLNEDPYKFTEKLHEGVNTVYDIVTHGLKLSEDGECLGTRSKKTGKYEWLKYSEVIKRSQYVGSGLQTLGISPGNQTRIGVYTRNCTEFVLTMLGCVHYSMVLVTLYDTFGSEATSFIIKQANLPVLVCDRNEKVAHILRDALNYPNLKGIVVTEEPSETIKLAAQSLNISLISFKELEERGKAAFKDPVPPVPDDIFVVCYTSGTTGQPKGAMISHKTVIVCGAALDVAFQSSDVRSIKGTIISYLPAAHMYEIMNEVLSMFYGRRIGFYSGDLLKIMEDLQELKPTVVPLVPRLMNRMYQGFKEKVNARFIPRQLLKMALRSKTKHLKSGRQITKNTMWDKILFRKFQEAIGGNAEVIVTTSAPISPEVMRFFRCAIGCPVFEAYGQTEVMACNMTTLLEHDGGFVGPPLPCNHVKLVDVPEMNYYSKDDVGEVCVKGPNLFNGYLENPDATKACFDDEGWVHTGDIGRWLQNGTLAIIDRKKYLFKLSQGEYIAPEKIENIYTQCCLVAQIYVDGLSDENFPVAVVVPDLAAFNSWVKRKNFKGKDTTDFLNQKEVRTEFLKELHRKGKSRGLNQLEQVRNIELYPHPLTELNGFLTPTMKLKRNFARKQFEEIIRNLYAEGQLINISAKKQA